MSPVQFGDVSLDAFFREYWRKKPLFVKGGAHAVLGRFFAPVEFLQICADLEQLERPRVSRLPCGTVFAQDLDRVCPELRAISQLHQRVWRAQNFWFDGTLATDSSGLGSHYDTSDNFILQQTGTKCWQLNARSGVPVRLQRDRLLGVEGEAKLDMPPNPVEFTVEAGDLLYIPLLWVHNGVSKGPSLSLTLAYNLDVPLDLLARDLKRQLSVERLWWDAIALLPLGAPEVRERENLDEALEAYFDSLLDVVGSKRFRCNVKRLWRRHFLPDSRD